MFPNYLAPLIYSMVRVGIVCCVKIMVFTLQKVAQEVVMSQKVVTLQKAVTSQKAVMSQKAAMSHVYMILHRWHCGN